jgi:hypothetical protein
VRAQEASEGMFEGIACIGVFGMAAVWLAKSVLV